MGSGAEIHARKIYFREGTSEIVETESVPSRFNRDGLQTSEIPRRIESTDVAGDLYPADAIDFDVAKASGEETRQLLIARADTLRLAIVWIARGGVARKKFVEGADLHSGFR
jgi:hypothetical protein